MLRTIRKLMGRLVDARARSMQRRINSELENYVVKHRPQNAAEIEHLVDRFYRNGRPWL